MKKAEILGLFDGNLRVPFAESPHSPLMDPINLENVFKPIINELYPDSVFDSNTLLRETELGSSTGPGGIDLPYNVKFTKQGQIVEIEGWFANKTGILLIGTDIFKFKPSSQFAPDTSVDEFTGAPTVTHGMSCRVYSDGLQMGIMVIGQSSNPRFEVQGLLPPINSSFESSHRCYFKLSYKAKQ